MLCNSLNTKNYRLKSKGLFYTTKTDCHFVGAVPPHINVVPEARIELARGITSTDFKSVASTNSATRAKVKNRGKDFIKNQLSCK